ncbi:MAG: hypothetical protein MUC28_02665 [Planctomycetes bacterium]|jgi:hypothetical protein|nr:hypothetical protein [Planctomycetota bacterium]
MEYFGEYGIRIPRHIERKMILLDFMEWTLICLLRKRKYDKISSLAAEIEPIKNEVEEWLNWAKGYIPSHTPAY